MATETGLRALAMRYEARRGVVFDCHLLRCAGSSRQPLLYVSLDLLKHREADDDHLQRVSTHGAWEEWLEYFRESIAPTANAALACLEDAGNLHG
jgi:cell filamentation protein, protein adenylyltransferase